jgi:erythritol kinase (D-erythritol 1-phosphate-forming)
MGVDQVVIGVDGGTTAVKAAAFSLDGRVESVHQRQVPVLYGEQGEAEQDMDAIWDGVANCLKEVQADVAGAEIVGIGLTGQGDGIWLVDREGRPTRRAANWLDGRAARRVNEWIADGRARRVFDVTGTTVFGGLFPVLYQELSKSDPEAVRRAETHLFCKDWLRYKLTGQRLTDYTEASRTFLDVSSVSEYSTELAHDLGEEQALRLLPGIRHADDLGGRVSAEAARCTGIPEGTPVGVGMIDVSATGVGLGAVKNGQGWLILGTTGFVGTLLPSVADRRSSTSMVLATGRGTQVLEFLAPMTGTPNLDWIRRVLGLAESSWDEIEQAARTVADGSGGVVYLPYASPGGERAPFLDTDASASWMGMSLTTPSASILRSVYEGVAFSLVECVRTLRMAGDLIVSGGGFRSNLLCEILSDVTGQRIRRQQAPEAGARGAAALALVSAGVARDESSAASMLETPLEEFDPHPEHQEIYRRTFEMYRRARLAVQPIWPDLRELRHAHAAADILSMA